MKMDDYQQAALRTANDPPPLWYLALGLCGEAGEVAEHVKKAERHGLRLDFDKMAEELGDLLWYLAVTAQRAGFTLSEVAEINVSKLKARYPAGFVPRWERTVEQTDALKEKFTEEGLICTCGDLEPDIAECLLHGAMDCPHNEELHYHHDGCPACDKAPVRSDPNKVLQWSDEQERLALQVCFAEYAAATGVVSKCVCGADTIPGKLVCADCADPF